MSPGDEILALLQTTPIDLKELEREAACLPAEDGELDGELFLLQMVICGGRGAMLTAVKGEQIQPSSRLNTGLALPV